MNWLKALRSRAGIQSQEELAAALQLRGLDISRSTVSHWEKDRYLPDFSNPELRIALAELLRVDLVTLLRSAGYEIQTSHSEIAERVAHIVDRLPPDKQRVILTVAEELSK